MSNEKVSTSCCIAGGGPAGIMLGYLLARGGVDVVVLEKHGDFLRDFRGDTIHPSTLEVMHELGLLDEFLKLPHDTVEELRGQVGDVMVTIADFRYLPTHCRAVLFMPQWDFLNFMVQKAAAYPNFKLYMNTEATDLLQSDGRIIGVRATRNEDSIEINADLVVGADGRGSIVREKAGLKVRDFGAPMDVLWFKISRTPGVPAHTMGKFEAGRIFVQLIRGDFMQCGYVIAKGQFEEFKKKGIEHFRQLVVGAAPDLKDRVHELRTWDDIKLLTVRVDRLSEWFRPGLICIGDAAHAMSPIGGVGINLAIQDAVAAANILRTPLLEKKVTTDHLGQIQKRRELPTRVTQGIQVRMQNSVIAKYLAADKPFEPPKAIQLLGKFRILRRIPARLIGLGIRPEHVRF